MAPLSSFGRRDCCRCTTIHRAGRPSLVRYDCLEGESEVVAGGVEAMTDRRRRVLAEKGRALFARACDGAACAEGFASHHLRTGEAEVVRDFVAFLRGELEGMAADDPRRAATEALVGRIEAEMG